MTFSLVITVLAIPVILSIATGLILLKRALSRIKILPEEIALAAAWVFIVGSLFWLGVYLSESTFLGFGVPWTWLTAAHFAFAGFGALTITSLSCRVVSSLPALRTLRFLIFVHPVAYLVTAAGILGYRFCDEIGAVAYQILFITQLGAVVFGRPDRMSFGPLYLLTPALMVPIATLVPAIAWAWERPLFDMTDMVRYHGIINAIGHVGLGLLAFAWGKAPSHAIIKKKNLLAH